MENTLLNSDEQKGKPVKAIIVSILIDIIGTTVLAFVAILGYAGYLVKTGGNANQLAAVLFQFDYQSPVQWVLLVLAGLISCYAGYYCAKTSRVNIYRNVAISAVIVTSISAFLNADLVSTVENFGLSVATILCYFVGAYLWIRKTA
ncbi:hypothetical protein [Vibrio neptunius]|uniref:hypothetical protein n=1 Tax=Vibrio neptunius TaxID=170651 RepID=UPI001C5CA6C8|nr:hypothetical protein [Vibrio neptunius]QXX08484.1 hypothetical protein KW548_22980 [Vibrio neptunius]